MKETLLTCPKFKSDCLNKTKSQTSTFELKTPASDYKIKINIESCIARFAKWSDVDINLYLYFSVIHALFSDLLKKKMRRRFGKNWEMIWRYKITARNKPVEKITGYRRLGKARRD
jgi:hypothetical protein